MGYRMVSNQGPSVGWQTNVSSQGPALGVTRGTDTTSGTATASDASVLSWLRKLITGGTSEGCGVCSCNALEQQDCFDSGGDCSCTFGDPPGCPRTTTCTSLKQTIPTKM